MFGSYNPGLLAAAAEAARATSPHPAPMSTQQQTSKKAKLWSAICALAGCTRHVYRAGFEFYSAGHAIKAGALVSSGPPPFAPAAPTSFTPPPSFLHRPSALRLSALSAFFAVLCSFAISVSSAVSAAIRSAFSPNRWRWNGRQRRQGGQGRKRRPGRCRCRLPALAADEAPVAVARAHRFRRTASSLAART